jgi:hypothetical protein
VKSYENKLGSLCDFEEVVIDDIELSPATMAMAEIMHPELSSSSSEPVGYCRPPVQYRFRKGVSGNPSGRKKNADADVFALFKASIMQSVMLETVLGKTKSSAIGVGCSQLIASAMKGSVGARRELREIIILLDKKGMLKPPTPKPSRARMKTLNGQKESMLKTLEQVIPIFRRSALDDMTKAYAARYGALS